MCVIVCCLVCIGPKQVEIRVLPDGSAVPLDLSTGTKVLETRKIKLALDPLVIM